MANHAEDAVRTYLNYVADPASIIDKGLIAQLETKVEQASDPISKLHAIAALEKAKTADGTAIRSAFVEHARAYADENGIPASAFRSLGVADSALAEAGFDLGFGQMKGKKAKLPAGRLRAPKVSKASIRAHVLSVNGSFTLSDIMNSVGGSIGTVNSVVQDLLNEKLVTSQGPDKNHRGRGRAPLRYSRS